MGYYPQITLTKEQKTALRKTKLAAKRLHFAIKELSKQWDQLETIEAPIGFMDTMYPFADKFDTVVYDTELWQEHITNKVNEILLIAHTAAE